ncbi:peroxiredoxin [Yunchengibacter salinarum]|uniref:peroxiredoxin n=1 Tax=Yunchengibacter salinarum TaxID=3133399 RepID=UPI0035B57987
MIKVGDSVPEGTFMVMTDDGPGPISADELFKGKKVAFFAVPGAFTPTCSARHLPGFVDKAASLRDKGVDHIACLSVNDVFVMDAWGKNAGVGDDVIMLADGNADYARALGLDFDGSKLGMGPRAQRFSMIVEDGKVTALNVEEPGAFEVSSADYMLGQL